MDTHDVLIGFVIRKRKKCITILILLLLLLHYQRLCFEKLDFKAAHTNLIKLIIIVSHATINKLFSKFQTNTPT